MNLRENQSRKAAETVQRARSIHRRGIHVTAGGNAVDVHGSPDIFAELEELFYGTE